MCFGADLIDEQELPFAINQRNTCPDIMDQKTVTLLVDPSDKATPKASVKFTGIPFLGWSLAENVPWLEAKPQSGPCSQSV